MVLLSVVVVVGIVVVVVDLVVVIVEVVVDLKTQFRVRIYTQSSFIFSKEMFSVRVRIGKGQLISTADPLKLETEEIH